MIGAVIQQKRKEAGFTQAQLAEYLGVSAPAVNRWEKNLSVPDAALLAPLARCLKTDLNELFSFYDSLSDKERERITNKARMMLFLEDEQEALAYIDETVHNNLSDGVLYKDLALVLLGAHAIRKVSNPTIYLDRIAEYFERARRLLPECEEELSENLINIYAAMGDREKAVEAWSRLSPKNPEKRWAHAEMLYSLGDYEEAIPEIKEIVLRKVIDLSQNIRKLADAMCLGGDKEMADLADDYDRRLRALFGLWRGFDVLSRAVSAIETRDPEAETVPISELISDDVTSDSFTTCPLFEGVSLGGLSREESTTADLMADVLAVLKDVKKKEG